MHNTEPKEWIDTHRIILMVEDSDEDFTAFMRVVQELNIPHVVHRVCDGDEALDYLYRTGDYTHLENTPYPAIILLDLNLPGTDGREVIQQVKQDRQLRFIPIVVLTTSSNLKDVAASYRSGANSYLIKPIGIEKLRYTVRTFFHYWFDTNVRPEVVPPQVPPE